MLSQRSEAKICVCTTNVASERTASKKTNLHNEIIITIWMDGK